jgi:C1A family cysteine protease
MAVKRGKTKGPEAGRPGHGTGFKGSTRKIAHYGWIPDLPDQRDFTYAVPVRLALAIPPSIDLRDHFPPVYDQGRIGSCTANAIAGALEFDMLKQGLDDFTPSRLFIYYNERAMEGTVPYDAGAQIRDGIKSVASQGDCPEKLWPYDDTPADPATGAFPSGAKAATQPPQACYDQAVQHKALNYRSITQNLADMKGCLAEGYPFIFGFSVYESFEEYDKWKDWTTPMPGHDERIIGGHAVLAVGYDDEEQVFIVRNSWGQGWGDAGYYYMPYAYLIDDNLSDDFWTIRLVQ